jgi:hypothetical protein
MSALIARQFFSLALYNRHVSGYLAIRIDSNVRKDNHHNGDMGLIARRERCCSTCPWLDVEPQQVVLIVN